MQFYIKTTNVTCYVLHGNVACCLLWRIRKTQSYKKQEMFFCKTVFWTIYSVYFCRNSYTNQSPESFYFSAGLSRHVMLYDLLYAYHVTNNFLKVWQCEPYHVTITQTMPFNPRMILNRPSSDTWFRCEYKMNTTQCWK